MSNQKTNTPVTRKQINELKAGERIIPAGPTRRQRRSPEKSHPIKNNRIRLVRLKQVAKNKRTGKEKVIHHVGVWPGIPRWMKYSDRKCCPY